MDDEESKEPESEPEPVAAPESSFSSSPSYVSKPPRKMGVIFRWIAILIILGLLIFGGISLFRSQQDKSETSATPTPTLEPTPSDTPTPVPSISPTPTKKPTPTPTSTAAVPSKGLTLKVLNGTDIAGRAATARDFLQGLGYTVSSIGNTETQDYDKTVITITSGKSSSLTSLQTDVGGKYVVGTASATLSTSEGVDALVIIGKQ